MLHVQFGVPYGVSSVLFAVALVVVFFSWDRTEHTLSFHEIDTPRRELFYWAAVVATFAMGTALGDLAAVTFGLGYLASGLVFAFADWLGKPSGSGGLGLGQGPVALVLGLMIFGLVTLLAVTRHDVQSAGPASRRRNMSGATTAAPLESEA